MECTAILIISKFFFRVPGSSDHLMSHTPLSVKSQPQVANNHPTATIPVTSFRALFQTTRRAHVGTSHAASLPSAETIATIKLAHLAQKQPARSTALTCAAQFDSFSRAIYSGVAQTFNLSFRRLQLTACSVRPLLAQDALLHPFALEPRTRAALFHSKRPPFADVPFVDALAAALASSPFASDAVRGLRQGAVVDGGG